MTLKTLITGATGFVGTHLLDRVVSPSSQVASLSNKEVSNKNVKSYVGDITEFKSARSAILDFRPEVIIHLAGNTSRSRKIEDLEEVMEANVKGTLNILKSVVKLENFKKLIVMGTGEEYGKNTTPFSEEYREMPISCYSLSKTMQAHMVEMFSRSYGIPCILLRPGVIYGPGQSENMFLPSLISSLNKNKTFSMTTGKQSRDFVYVSDVVDALVQSIHTEFRHFQIVNIGTGVALSISELADMVGVMLDKRELIKKGALTPRSEEVED